MDNDKIADARKAIEKAASLAGETDARLEAFCKGIKAFAKEAGISEEHHETYVDAVLNLMEKEAGPISALIGGGLGAGAGSLIAGPGARGKGALAGSLIGGGAGLLGQTTTGGLGALLGGGVGALTADKKNRSRNAIIGVALGGGAGVGGGMALDYATRDVRAALQSQIQDRLMELASTLENLDASGLQENIERAMQQRLGQQAGN